MGLIASSTGGEDAIRVPNGPSRRRLKAYREFDVQNRMEGTVGYFTVSVPIGIDTAIPRRKT
jgi:hypothetical protein